MENDKTKTLITGMVTKYHCKYCDTYCETLSEIIQHLGVCLSNPENRGCPTCSNVYWGDQDESGRSFCDFGISGYPKVLNCNRWLSVRLKLLESIDRTLALFKEKYPDQEDEVLYEFENGLEELKDILK